MSLVISRSYVVTDTVSGGGLITGNNPVIGWRTLANAQINHAGSVRFQPAPGGRGTEVVVTAEYVPPAGALGVVIAKLFGKEPGQQIEEDLRNFKQLMEVQATPVSEENTPATGI